MPPDAAMLDRFRTRDVPYRMVAVDGLHWFCEWLQLPEPRPALVVTVHGAPVPASLLTNGIVEMGLASLRALAEFLGLRYDGKTDSLARRTDRRADDASIQDFDRPEVTPELAGFTDLETPGAVREALAYALRMANKGVAHLTYGEIGGDPKKLALAARSVWRLTSWYFYGEHWARAHAVCVRRPDGTPFYVSEFRYPARIAIEWGRLTADLAAIEQGAPEASTSGEVQ